MLEYIIQWEVSDPYGVKTKRRSVTERKFRLWINAFLKDHDIEDTHATISSRLPHQKKSIWNFARRREHILLLDCDDLDSLYAATRYLKREGIAWAGIESSPDHFWIVTDCVGTFGEMRSLLLAIPGVDDNYIKMVNSVKKFTLRAIRKPNRVPKFGDYGDLTDPRVIAWYEAFRAFHEDPAVNEDLAIINGVKTGTMHQIAADPSFDV